MEYIQDDTNRVEATPALSRQDQENLNALTITGYILGGATALFSCFGLIYVVMGLAFALNMLPADARSSSPPPPAAMGWIFVAIGAFVVLYGWLVGGLTILAARRLAARRGKTFIQVMAGFNCLHMPFGTVWGVFVFVVLSRPSVAALFDNPAVPPIKQ